MYKILLLLLFSFSFSHAQVSISPVFGKIGDKTAIAISIQNSNFKHSNDISFGFELSNPTVFYPDSVTCDIPQKQLRFYNLSYGKYQVTINNIKSEFVADSLTILLHGEMLAGYDSVCVVNFTNFRINDEIINDLSTIVYLSSLGTPLPYIRRSVLSINSPNPVFAGNSTEWGFRTDASVEVTFLIYELSGRLLEKIDFGIAEPGVHKFSFNTAQTFAAGTYLITMVTPISLHTRFFNVIK